MPKDVLDYFEGGALDEITLRENTAGWERLCDAIGLVLRTVD